MLRVKKVSATIVIFFTGPLCVNSFMLHYINKILRFCNALMLLQIYKYYVNFSYVKANILFCFTGMHQPPYYTNYSRSRLLVHNVVTSKYFDLAIAAVIGLNVITMAMEFYMMPKVYLL